MYIVRLTTRWTREPHKRCTLWWMSLHNIENAFIPANIADNLSLLFIFCFRKYEKYHLTSLVVSKTTNTSINSLVLYPTVFRRPLLILLFFAQGKFSKRAEWVYPDSPISLSNCQKSSCEGQAETVLANFLVPSYHFNADATLPIFKRTLWLMLLKMLIIH